MSLQSMKTAEYYVKNSADIDLSKCTFVPEAPRIRKYTESVTGHSEAVNERHVWPMSSLHECQ